MNDKKSYSPEVRERAIRMVREQRDQYKSEWAAISSIAEKFGCKAETLRLWIRQDERDSGQRPGPTTEDSEELKRLKRENFDTEISELSSETAPAIEDGVKRLFGKLVEDTIFELRL